MNRGNHCKILFVYFDFKIFSHFKFMHPDAIYFFKYIFVRTLIPNSIIFCHLVESRYYGAGY